MIKPLLTLSLFLISATATAAMPHASLNQLVNQDSDCENAKVSNGFADLVHNINLQLEQGMTTWIEPRGPLSSKASDLGLNADDLVRIRKTIGYVICPGSTSGNGFEGTAMVVGDGTQIVTDAHIFIDEDTGQRREPLSDCVFINQAVPHDIVKLDFSSDRSYKFYTNNTKAEWYNDRAIVHLKSRITGTRAFPIDFDSKPILPGDKIIMISADQKQLTFPMAKDHVKFPVQNGRATAEVDVNREPIAQSCIARSYYPASGHSSSVLYTECNTTKGASGSVMFTKENGVLHARALLTQGGNPVADYKPFKVGKGVPEEELSFAMGIGLDPAINTDINQIQMATDNTHMAADAPRNGF